MAKVVCEACKLNEINIDAVSPLQSCIRRVEILSNTFGNLGYFQGVGQSVSKKIGFSTWEELCFAL